MRYLGGWTISGITTIQSGAPLTFLMGDDVALDGTFGDQHAQLGPGVTVNDIVHRSLEPRRHDRQASSTPAPLCRPTRCRAELMATPGRGLISGPALNATDLAVMKDFPFTEQLRLQLRGEAFNAFNQVNFGNPVTNVSSSAFGRIRSAGDPRIMQVALKLIW